MITDDPCYIMVDVEADGPAPGLYSMLAIGAVVVESNLDRTFKAYLRPLDGAKHDPESAAIGGFTRESIDKDPHVPPAVAMQAFADWITELGIKRPVFIADNNGFDWQFINYYFHLFLGRNPFGFSSQNLNSIYRGAVGNMRASFKHLRKTRHDHDPLNDAIGNAEAMLKMFATVVNKRPAS